MKKSLLIIVSVFFVLIVKGQKIAMEVSAMHFLSNGINIGYEVDLGKHWTLEIGPRIMVNTYSLNNNNEHNIFYQNGFAYNFVEHFGLYNKLSKTIFNYRKFNLEGFANLMITNHGIKARYDNSEMVNRPPEIPEIQIEKTNAATAIELTVGPRINFITSEKITLKAMFGYGINVYFYGDYGVSLVTGIPIHRIRSSDWQRKWDVGYVGTDGPNGRAKPMMALGLTYSLRK